MGLFLPNRPWCTPTCKACLENQLNSTLPNLGFFARQGIYLGLHVLFCSDLKQTTPHPPPLSLPPRNPLGSNFIRLYCPVEDIYPPFPCFSNTFSPPFFYCSFCTRIYTANCLLGGANGLSCIVIQFLLATQDRKDY